MLSKRVVYVLAAAVSVASMLASAPATAGCMSCGCGPGGLLQVMQVAPPPCGYSGGPVYVVNQGPAYGEPVPYIARPAVHTYPYAYGHHGYGWGRYHRHYGPRHYGHRFYYPRRPYAHRHGPMIRRHAMRGHRMGHHRMMGHRAIYRGRPAFYRGQRFYRAGPYGARRFIGYRAGPRAGYGPRYQRPYYRRGGLATGPVPTARPGPRLHDHDVKKGP